MQVVQFTDSYICKGILHAFHVYWQNVSIIDGFMTKSISAPSRPTSKLRALPATGKSGATGDRAPGRSAFSTPKPGMAPVAGFSSKGGAGGKLGAGLRPSFSLKRRFSPCPAPLQNKKLCSCSRCIFARFVLHCSGQPQCIWCGRRARRRERSRQRSRL